MTRPAADGVKDAIRFPRPMGEAFVALELMFLDSPQQQLVKSTVDHQLLTIREQREIRSDEKLAARSFFGTILL